MGIFERRDSPTACSSFGAAMTLSRGDLRHILDLSTRCLSAETGDHLSGIVSSLGNILSFEKAVLCAMTEGASAISLDHYVNHSYGARWAELYERHRFQSVDPVLSHCHSTDGAFWWRDAFRQARPQDRSSTFVEAAREFGLVDGVAYTCSTQRSPIRTVLSLTKAECGDRDRALTILGFIGPHLHEAYRRVLRHCDDGHEVSLSEREKEILGWTQQGKTYWEIGCILGISQRTVKYHFARIKAKLDVVNASHAVAKAMRMGVLG
jgi:DNA-binding CsgD family transcriptional regulator